MINRPFIFEDMGLTGNSTNLLATGVVGILEFIFTFPAVFWVDQLGRKKTLIAGAIGMAVCHFIVAGIIATYRDSWATHRSAGWAAVVFVWIYAANFAYSWGKETSTRTQKTQSCKPLTISYRTMCMDRCFRGFPTQHAC